MKPRPAVAHIANDAKVEFHCAVLDYRGSEALIRYTTVLQTTAETWIPRAQILRYRDLPLVAE